LAPCDYHSGCPAEKLKAVGWLAREYAYPVRQAELSDEHFRKLLQLLTDPWEPASFLGRHDCDLCIPGKGDVRDSSLRNVQPTPRPHFEDDRFTLKRYGLVIHFGVSNLFVPGENCIYLAPSMIVHYIDKHNYEPPAEFWRAVLNCPDMRSDSYKQALLANGPSDPEWIRALSGH
jgi:hypothetical protein